MDQIIKMALGIASDLHPAWTILDAIYGYYMDVKYAKGQCEAVVRRAIGILQEIDQQISTFKKTSPESYRPQEQLQHLKRELELVRTIMRKQAAMTWLKSLLRSDEIKANIIKAHHRLTDCLNIFSIKLELEILRQVHEQTHATQQDRVVLGQIISNQQELLRKIDVKSDDEADEAMAAIQKKLNSTIKSKDDIEVAALKESLRTLQMSTKRSPSEQPKWVITTYDLPVIEPGDEIGSGGFSTVYKATWAGITVAVKQLKGERTSHAALKMEAQLWSDLRHDHIVPFYGASFTAAQPFIVSRYMQHGNLLSYLRNYGESANRVQLLYEVSLGMLYLHKEKVVHGDLKCVNVLVDDAGKALITDFGLSRIKTSNGKEDGVWHGTLRFMAPEALERGVQSFQTDVYAFGMTIYEAFTGDPPFMLKPDALVQAGVLKLDRPSDSKAEELGLSDQIWDLLQACIKKQPEERPDFGMITDEMDTSRQLFKSSPAAAASVPAATHHGGLSGPTVIGRAPSKNRMSSAEDKQKNIQTGLARSPLAIKSSVSSGNSGPAGLSMDPISLIYTMRHPEATMNVNAAGQPTVTIVIKGKNHTLSLHPKPNSFQVVSGTSGPNTVVCSTETEPAVWTISGTRLVCGARSGQLEVNFANSHAAKQWFDAIVAYAKGRPLKCNIVGGHGNFIRRGSSLRRVINGEFQSAGTSGTHATITAVVRPNLWTKLPLPRWCLIDRRVDQPDYFSCEAEYNPDYSLLQYQYWSFKIEGSTVYREGRENKVDRVASYIEEEKCPSVEAAEAWFNANRAAFEKISLRSAERTV